MKNLVTLGSVICGTHRNEDLIPAFVDALDDIRERLAAPGTTTEEPAALAERVKMVAGLDNVLGGIEKRMEAEGYFESEDADWDLNEILFPILDQHAPPFCYFGSHEGDGADFGFWISWDAIEDACHDGSILRVRAGDTWRDGNLTEEVEFVLEVTDHGNASLFTCGGEEVWSVV